MFCSVNLNGKVFKSQIFLFIFKIRAALHIGEPSDCAVWFPSSGENLAFIYFLSSMYVGDKKKNSQGTKQLSTCLRFFLNYLKVDITSSAQM